MNRLWNNQTAEIAAHWAQVLAIIGAAIWAILYTVGYKEFFEVQRGPAHLTTSISIEGSKAIKNRIPAIIKLKIKNETKREIFTLPSIFIVWGITDQQQMEFNEFIEGVNDFFESARDNSYGMYKLLDDLQPIAIGKILSYRWRLEPGETYLRTFVVDIPAYGYEAIEVSAYVLTAKNTEELGIKWKYNEDDVNFFYLSCRKRNRRSNDCKPLNENLVVDNAFLREKKIKMRVNNELFSLTKYIDPQQEN